MNYIKRILQPEQTKTTWRPNTTGRAWRIETFLGRHTVVFPTPVRRQSPPRKEEA